MYLMQNFAVKIKYSKFHSKQKTDKAFFLYIILKIDKVLHVNQISFHKLLVTNSKQVFAQSIREVVEIPRKSFLI